MVRYRSAVRFVVEGIEGMAVLPLVLLTWPVAKRWLANWGSRPEDRDHAWPGDDLVTQASVVFTRAVDISAPAAEVWKWVVQFGLNRAGFYSYELFERVAGIPVRNVESVMPAHQTLAVGDEIRLHPRAPGVPVAAVSPARALCFGETGPVDEHRSPDPRRSWSMYIEPVTSDRCRLVLRSCIEPLRSPTWRKRLGLALDAPVDFVMEQRMLRTIRRLAETGTRANLHASGDVHATPPTPRQT